MVASRRAARLMMSSLASSARGSSKGAHWNGVQGLGTKEEIDSVSLPKGWPSGPGTCRRSSSRAASSGMASTSSRVSVGRPIMK